MRGDHVFRRGNKLWITFKHPDTGEWVSKPTPYRVGQEELAKEVARRVDAALDKPKARAKRESAEQVRARHEAAVASTSAQLAAFGAPLTGQIYAVRLFPEMLPRRLKIGYTGQYSISRRLGVIRTTSPEAVLVALWQGDRDLEKKVHMRIPGRVRGTDVHDVEDWVAAIGTIDTVLGYRTWSIESL